MNTRGFFEIGIFQTKNELNIGMLWRSAYRLGASGIFTIGKRYKKQVCDTYKTPRHIPLRHYLTLEEMLNNKPLATLLVGVEFGGVNLTEFKHPQRAIYLLGAEDNGLSKEAINASN